jgi:hypothetical protein
MPIGISPDVDQLFDTSPKVPAKPKGPAVISGEFKMRIIAKIQQSRIENNGYRAKLVRGDVVAKLDKSIADGEVVEAALHPGVYVLLKQSADLESATSFFYRTSQGFAPQTYGPFSI